MKKRFLSLLMVFCLMLSLAPAAFATDADDLQTRINNAEAGSTVTLSGNETISSTITINKALTLEGNGNTLTMTGGTYAIKVDTNDAVTIKNLTVEATTTGGRGVLLNKTQPNATLDNCTLTVNNRGVGFSDDGTTAGTVTIQNSTIQNSQIPSDASYDNWALCTADTRGIAMWNTKGLTLNIDNSTIQGFAYTVNLTGDADNNGIRDFTGTTVNVKNNSKLKGWTAFNVWSAYTTFNIENSYLLGINTWSGGNNDFATIVVNDDIYGKDWGQASANEFNITGGTITNAKTGTNKQQLFRIDNKGITKVNFSKYTQGRKSYNVSIIDGTGDSTSVFFSGFGTLPDGWTDWMNSRVTGNTNCTLTGYNSATLEFIPD